MPSVSSNNIAVSSASFPASPALKQAQSVVDFRQSTSPPASSQPAIDFIVSISPEAQDAAARVSITGEAQNNRTDATGEQKTNSTTDVTKDTKTSTIASADKSNFRVAVESDSIEEESRKITERLKAERRNEEENLRLEKESAKAAEQEKNERKKAENEKQAEKSNILDVVLETTRSSDSNRMLIDAAINGYQIQSGSVNVIGGTSEDSTTLFIQRSSNQSLSSIDLLV